MILLPAAAMISGAGLAGGGAAGSLLLRIDEDLGFLSDEMRSVARQPRLLRRLLHHRRALARRLHLQAVSSTPGLMTWTGLARRSCGNQPLDFLGDTHAAALLQGDDAHVVAAAEAAGGAERFDDRLHLVDLRLVAADGDGVGVRNRFDVRSTGFRFAEPLDERRRRRRWRPGRPTLINFALMPFAFVMPSRRRMLP